MKKIKLIGATLATTGGLAAATTLFCGALNLNKNAEQNIMITWGVATECSTWGTLSGDEPTEITKPTKLYDLSLPTTVPAAGAHFEGWFIGEDALSPNTVIDPADYPDGVTILAKFYPTIEQFKLSPNVITIDKADNPETPAVGELYPITLDYLCSAEGYTPTFAWTVDDDEVIGLKDPEVSNGKEIKNVYGKKVGDATITVSYDIGTIHRETSCAVHVSDTPILPEKINVRPHDSTITHDLDVGFSDVAMDALVTPEAASQDVTWSSSNQEIATVDATTGVVSSPTDGKPGTVIISAKSQTKGSIVGFWTFYVHSAFVPVTKVDFPQEPTDTPIDIQVGGTHQMTAFISGQEGAEPTYKSIQWVVVGDDAGQHIKVGIDGLITATNIPTSPDDHIYVRAVSHGGSDVETEVFAEREVRVLGDSFNLNIGIKDQQKPLWSDWFQDEAPKEAAMGSDIKLELTPLDPRTVIKEARASIGGVQYDGKVETVGGKINVTFNKEFFYGTTETTIEISLTPELRYNVTYELAGAVKSASTDTPAIVGQDSFVANFLTDGTGLNFYACHVYADGTEIEGSITGSTGNQVTITGLSTHLDATNIVVHLDTTMNPEYATITLTDGAGIKTYIEENLGETYKRIALRYDIDNFHSIATTTKQLGGMYINIDGTDYEYGSPIWTLNEKEKKVEINMESIGTEHPVVNVYMNTKENDISFQAQVSPVEAFEDPAFEMDSYELGEDFVFYWLLADESWALDDDAAKDFYEINLLLSSGKAVTIKGGYVGFEPESDDPTRVKTTIEWNPLWETYSIVGMTFHAAAKK